VSRAFKALDRLHHTFCDFQVALLCTHWVVAVVTRTIGHTPATTQRRSHAGFAPATGAIYEQTTRARFLVLSVVADYEEPTRVCFLVLNAVAHYEQPTRTRLLPLNAVAHYEQPTRTRLLLLNAVAHYEQPTRTRLLLLNAVAHCEQPTRTRLLLLNAGCTHMCLVFADESNERGCYTDQTCNFFSGHHESSMQACNCGA
jgi:hypothetical protein